MKNIPAPAAGHDGGIRLGVVGHRLNRLSTEDLDGLRGPIHGVLADLNVLGQEERPMTVVTSLAEGADRLVAAEALALDIPLDVVLPYPIEQFLEDFPALSSKAEFRKLIKRARTVTEPSAGGSGAESGYHWASETIVAHADLLLAIWDGEPGRGQGGTAWTIDSALTANVPVIWLLSREPWSIDIVEPDDGLDLHPLDPHLTQINARHARTNEKTPPLSRKALNLI